MHLRSFNVRIFLSSDSDLGFQKSFTEDILYISPL